MRLKSIKLAGFKSFVDATTVPFQSNMTAVVGPNGCGKSNIIDAVRWVMGESSAKHLRGESMADVIFNGSVSRKPVSRAAIELVFDNHEGRAGGEYAAFAEISVKREVTRDGQSKYFLNGSVCRRRDVTDLFLGTGLGPRSYAIIEQGMIARIIEAKPEELRTYVEEAAGVSKYKERRRETESRIGRTRENLERLTDLSDELGRQLDRLKRQADAAARYKILREDARDLEALTLWYELQSIREQVDTHVQRKQDAERELDQHQSQLAVNERERIAQQIAREEANRELETANSAYYTHAANLSRLEANRDAHQEQLLGARRQRERIVGDIEKLTRLMDEDAMQAQRAEDESTTLAPEIDALETRQQDVARQITAIEEKLSVADLERGHLASELGRVKSELTRLETERLGLDRQATLERARLADIDRALLTLSDTDPALIAETSEALALVEQQVHAMSVVCEQQAERFTEASDTLIEAEERWSEASAAAETASAELARAQRIIKAEATIDDAETEVWVASQSTIIGRAVELLQLPEHARSAFETCFPDWLAAFVSTDLKQIDVKTLPAGVRVIDQSALASLGQRVQLTEHPWEAGEGYTHAGLKYGQGWIERVAGSATGILDLQAKIPSLESACALADAALEQLHSALADARAYRDSVLVEKNDADQQLAALQTEKISVSNRLLGMQAKAKEVAESRDRLTRERQSLDAAAAGLQDETAKLDAQLENVRALKSQLQDSLTPVHQALDADKATLTRLRHESQQMGQTRTALAVQSERLTGQIERAQSQMARVKAQLSQLETELQAAVAEETRLLEHPAVTPEALSDAVAQSQVLEEGLTRARVTLGESDAKLRELEQARSELERQREDIQTRLGDIRLQQQAVEIEQQRLQDALKSKEATEAKLVELEQRFGDLNQAREELARVETRIERLGPINLVAVEEYQRELERKTELDLQHAELTEALETLEDAIRKIDRETRALFRNTFDAINQSFGEIFPELFGGGEAWLMLTDEDLLSTGVSIMARPPGKRNSSIYLLSGGEKALTALALVFAIFRLNPAPFCLLDEVDAPLDDANVGRYAEAVAKMAQSVQFIYITHNKIAMERASQLMGVTMSEPGVSRLVSVDIERAVELASQE